MKSRGYKASVGLGVETYVGSICKRRLLSRIEMEKGGSDMTLDRYLYLLRMEVIVIQL